MRPFPRRLLQRGNAKLGNDVWTFSLPAVVSCPGSTRACRDRCYARKGYFAFRSVRKTLSANLRLARTAPARLAVVVAAQLARPGGPRLVRVHVSGDLFGAKYTWAWTRVVAEHPDVRFYLYTRSWRVPRVAAVLAVLAALPNARVWYSFDADSGVPPAVPPRVRLAYLAAGPADVPPAAADLVFRDYPDRRTRAVRVGGVLVCPLENGTGWAGTCSACGLCFGDLAGGKDPRARKRPPVPGGRVPLAVV